MNCFLDDPEDAPAAGVDYVAEQLGLQTTDLKGYKILPPVTVSYQLTKKGQALLPALRELSAWTEADLPE